MAKDTCLHCGKPLPANKELASVPNGRLVAFDPDANRVWRICAKCHHWNLLGPEASAAAIPELAVRFAALPSAGPEGLAKAKVSGRLDLFRVGGAQERAAAILELSEARKELTAPVSLWEKLIFGAFLAYLASNAYRVITEPPWQALVGVAICFGIMWSVMEYGGGTQVGYRPRGGKWMAPALAVVGMAGAGLGVLTASWALLAGALGLLFGWVGRRDARRKSLMVWTPGSSDLRFAGNEMKGLHDEWLSLLVLPDLNSPQQASDALDRFEELGSLPRVLSHLTAERGTPEGFLDLNRMTVEDRLLLGVATRVAGTEPGATLRIGLPDAKLIAEVAESLDHPTGQA
jgi:hypothetical protein